MLFPSFLVRYLWKSYFWQARVIADGKYYYPYTSNTYRKGGNSYVHQIVPYFKYKDN